MNAAADPPALLSCLKARVHRACARARAHTRTCARGRAHARTRTRTRTRACAPALAVKALDWTYDGALGQRRQRTREPAYQRRHVAERTSG